MNTIKNYLLLLSVSLALGGMLVSCSKATYKKTKGGLPYQLYKGKDTQQIRFGDFIKIQFTQTIKDSVYFTTVGALPEYRQVNEAQVLPYDISELWTSLRVGDSVVTTQLMDTFIKRDPTRIPLQFKKGDKIKTFVKVLAIFKSDSLARADYENTTKEWLVSEVKVIEKYVADKKINAQKTPSGVYVEILNPGTGNRIDSGKYISCKYTGTSWSGKKFDSNVDHSFGHTDPLSFVVGSSGPGSMIKGFDEAVRVLGLGGKARAYIPSSLAYAGNPGSPLIKPFESLIFDIEVIDIKDKMPARQDMSQQPPTQKFDNPQPNN